MMELKIFLVIGTLIGYLVDGNSITKNSNKFHELSNSKLLRNAIAKRYMIKGNKPKRDTIYNDQFIINVLGNDLTYKKVISIYHPSIISDKVVRDIHNKEQKDRILSFEASDDSFSFYKGTEKMLLQQMTIASKKITLDKSLRIGVDKALFEDKFKRSPLSDVFSVMDIEGGNEFTFVFKNNKLVKVLYNLKYLD